MKTLDANPLVRVWDRFVRLFHWALVLSFFGAYLSTDDIDGLHALCGYIALALVLARGVWGFVGRGHARFASFVPSPQKLVDYLVAMVQRREPRHLGHNPAGAVMIVFLLCAVAGTGITGWMLTLDAFWGNGTVEDLHVLLVDSLLLAIALHVSAGVYASLRHHENLVVAMMSGRKRPSADPLPTSEAATESHAQASASDPRTFSP